METKSRTPIYIVIGLTLVAVLAAAAFLAGRLMNRQGEEECASLSKLTIQPNFAIVQADQVLRY